MVNGKFCALYIHAFIKKSVNLKTWQDLTEKK